MFSFGSTAINYDERFPHLEKAPIVEAVINFRILPSSEPWNPTKIKEILQTTFKEYPKIEEGREIKIDMKDGQPKDLGCTGFRLTSIDRYYIAQFNKTEFVLSRVKKYEDWEKFLEEAKKTWALYCSLLKPHIVKRIGVRYINKMPTSFESKNFYAFFQSPPKQKQIAGWVLDNFIHRDSLCIPGTSYKANIIKTLVSSLGEKAVDVLLDVDAFLEKDESCEWNSLSKHLKAMHWIKNKAFFGSINKNKLKDFK
jgi:uncharacterized protein (TIGR04255 family)